MRKVFLYYVYTMFFCVQEKGKKTISGKGGQIKRAPKRRPGMVDGGRERLEVDTQHGGQPRFARDIAAVEFLFLRGHGAGQIQTHGPKVEP